MEAVLRKISNRGSRLNPKRSIHFWIRSETKAKERRTILPPSHTKTLLDAGHKVSVEECPQRCVPILEYSSVGCEIVPRGSWVSSPKDTVILGLKEVPEDIKSLSHRHVMFGHCYKGQSGAKSLLQKFKAGGGALYDLEFLFDSKGKRVAAFGSAAGSVGMAVGLLVYAWSKLESSTSHPPLNSTFPSYPKLAQYVASKIEPLLISNKISVLIIGAKGRVGGGATSFISLLPQKLKENIHIIEWDVADTKGKSGPFKEIMDVDIFVNAILLPPPPPSAVSQPPSIVFVSDDLIRKTGNNRNLRVIADLSCDVSNPRNPIQISSYKSTTDFDRPNLRVTLQDKISVPLDIIAIDHLPALVPYESSMEFADSLLPYLIQFQQNNDKGKTWSEALNLFNEHAKNV